MLVHLITETRRTSEPARTIYASTDPADVRAQWVSLVARLGLVSQPDGYGPTVARSPETEDSRVFVLETLPLGSSLVLESVVEGRDG